MRLAEIRILFYFFANAVLICLIFKHLFRELRAIDPKKGVGYGAVCLETNWSCGNPDRLDAKPEENLLRAFFCL